MQQERGGGERIKESYTVETTPNLTPTPPPDPALSFLSSSRSTPTTFPSLKCGFTLLLPPEDDYKTSLNVHEMQKDEIYFGSKRKEEEEEKVLLLLAIIRQQNGLIF